MAELSDWLNQTVIRLNNANSSQTESLTEVRVSFQQKVFVDNSIGWNQKINAEIIVPAFCFRPEAIFEFTEAAREWLELPIDRLGVIYFVGEWQLGEPPFQLTLSFDRYPQTLSKTDWFSVKIYLGTGDFFWNYELHIDYTGLALFVAGLSTEGFTSPALSNRRPMEMN